MKLSDARSAYYELSKTLSDLVRKLGFAAIALIWLFTKADTNSAAKSPIPSDLHLPTILIVLSLVLDFLQYAWSTAAWGGFARLKELQPGAHDADFDAPNWLNWPSLLFFWCKVVSTVAAYCLILRFLFRTLWR